MATAYFSLHLNDLVSLVAFISWSRWCKFKL